MCEARLQFPVGLCHWKLWELLGKVIRRTEKEPRVGFSQHGGVVVGIAGGQDVKVEQFERSHRIFFLIRHPHVVVDDAAGVIDFQLIAKERRKSQLTHQRVGKLIEGVG